MERFTETSSVNRHWESISVESDTIVSIFFMTPKRSRIDASINNERRSNGVEIFFCCCFVFDTYIQVYTGWMWPTNSIHQQFQWEENRRISMHQFLIFSYSIKYLPIGKYKRLLPSHEQQLLSNVEGESNRTERTNECMNQLASDQDKTDSYINQIDEVRRKSV